MSTIHNLNKYCICFTLKKKKKTTVIKSVIIIPLCHDWLTSASRRTTSWILLYILDYYYYTVYRFNVWPVCFNLYQKWLWWVYQNSNSELISWNVQGRRTGLVQYIHYEAHVGHPCRRKKANAWIEHRPLKCIQQKISMRTGGDYSNVRTKEWGSDWPLSRNTDTQTYRGCCGVSDRQYCTE